jgi:hypothetical protein
MKRPRLNPRKLLVASAGVATMNYALAAGCSGSKKSQEWIIANLMPGPPCCVDDGIGGSFPGTVANLVAPPPPISPPPPLFEPRDAAVQDAAPGDAAADGDAG